jgi:SGNH domain (fused to AT3 domains)
MALYGAKLNNATLGRICFATLLIGLSVATLNPGRAGATNTTDYPTWSSLPTLTSVQNLVSAGAALKATPTSAPLVEGGFGADPAEIGGQSHCSPSSTPHPYTYPPCTYGDRHSTKVVVVVGDSEASMWIPTFDLWGVHYKIKIEDLSMNGCDPWHDKLPAPNASWTECKTWKAYLAHEIESLDPLAVVATAMESDEQEGPVTVSSTRLAKSIEGFFSSLVTTKAKLFALSPIPWYFNLPSSPNSCIYIHVSDPSACAISSPNPTMSRALELVSASRTAKVVDINQLFCTKSLCPVIAGNFIMYVDNHHMAHGWAIEIARAFGDVFNPMIGLLSN